VRLCQNHAKLTISSFGAGPPCVRQPLRARASTEKVPRASDLPNLFDYKYKRLFGYRRLTDADATRGEIGIPRVLNMYENYPLWFTISRSSGSGHPVAGRATRGLRAGMESIPSENVCYPAKLAHGTSKSP